MKHTLFTLLLTSHFLCFQACSQNKKEENYDVTSVVKIVTTKAYVAKPNFDKLIPGEPAGNLGYEEKMGLDWSWRRSYFDSFDNLLCLEKISASSGNELIYKKIYQKYFSHSDGKVSSRREVGFNNGKEELYNKTIFIRDEKGKIKEIQKTSNTGKLIEKTLRYYNDSEQKIKSETFLENGLTERIVYEYDTPDLKTGKLLKRTIEKFSDKKEIEITDFLEYQGTDLTSSRYRKYLDNELVSDISIKYLNYYKGEAKTTIEDGYNELEPEIPYTRTITKSFDDKGNMIRYQQLRKELKERKKEFQGLFSSLEINLDYNMEYSYNEKGDWIQIIFSPSKEGEKYLIQRDIVYK